MNRVFQLLGLARRAGKLVSGEEGVLDAVRSGRAKLVIVARDASPGSVKKYMDKCRFYGVDIVQAGNREELGRSIGKPGRVVVALMEEGFAGLVRKAIEEHGNANPREVRNIEQAGKAEGI